MNEDKQLPVVQLRKADPTTRVPWSNHEDPVLPVKPISSDVITDEAGNTWTRDALQDLQERVDRDPTNRIPMGAENILKRTR